VIGTASAVAEPAPRAAAANFDLRKLSAEFIEDPYPTYRALRQFDPIHLMADGSYFLTRYDDCLAVYRDTETWSSDKKLDFRPNFSDSLLYEHHTTSLVFNDPPYHTRVRKLLAPAFTPRALRALQPRIEALVNRLLAAAAARGEIDLIADFAAAIPVALIGDMLGIPPDERAPLRGWSLAILGALEPVLSREKFAAGVTAVADFKNYLSTIVAGRLDNAKHDPAEILSTLTDASEFSPASAPGERLSKLELLHNCIFLLNAGHETTTNLIGNAVDLLIRHPDATRDLREHPQAIETAVEEFLRMESSNQLGNRRAVKDTRLGGVAIPAGSYVHICIGAANRDPGQFTEPDRLDIRREPNRHLAFGTGIHACAGMSLARMEAQVAIGRLLQRFARIAPAGAPTRTGRARFRGFGSYPIRLS
jgi:cytochrome P450